MTRVAPHRWLFWRTFGTSLFIMSSMSGAEDRAVIGNLRERELADMWATQMAEDPASYKGQSESKARKLCEGVGATHSTRSWWARKSTQDEYGARATAPSPQAENVGHESSGPQHGSGCNRDTTQGRDVDQSGGDGAGGNGDEKISKGASTPGPQTWWMQEVDETTPTPLEQILPDDSEHMLEPVCQSTRGRTWQGEAKARTWWLEEVDETKPTPHEQVMPEDSKHLLGPTHPPMHSYTVDRAERPGRVEHEGNVARRL
jgi:hypothetical protein